MIKNYMQEDDKAGQKNAPHITTLNNNTFKIQFREKNSQKFKGVFSQNYKCLFSMVRFHKYILHMEINLIISIRISFFSWSFNHLHTQRIPTNLTVT